MNSLKYLCGIQRHVREASTSREIWAAIMTEKVYDQQVLRTLQYQAYARAYSDSLTYTDAEMQDAYQADPKTYDKAAWEYVVVSGAADSTTDADGNTVQPTDEEQAAAKEAAKATAEEILAAYNSGKSSGIHCRQL